ncbi:hypothetical protein RRG08_003252 [Elysia crispata]|uniref:Uncharacterized protein n=1 Tax=Elysia crispata TaxID=231223 RepID=A0AAE1B071_9GAST|nr:hypothetical protein RRG08_003252 [Elysia crispata]
MITERGEFEMCWRQEAAAIVSQRRVSFGSEYSSFWETCWIFCHLANTTMLYKHSNMTLINNRLRNAGTPGQTLKTVETTESVHRCSSARLLFAYFSGSILSSHPQHMLQEHAILYR